MAVLVKNLTARQQEAALRGYNDLPSQEIAERMFVSMNTVKAHIYILMRAFGVHNHDKLRFLLSALHIDCDSSIPDF